MTTPMMLLNDYCTRLGTFHTVSEVPAPPPNPPGLFLTEISVARGLCLPPLVTGKVGLGPLSPRPRVLCFSRGVPFHALFRALATGKQKGSEASS